MPNPYKRLADAVEDYLRYRSARFATTTVQQEGFVLRRFLAETGDIQVRHLRAERVSDWFYGEGGLMQRHTTPRRPIPGAGAAFHPQLLSQPPGLVLQVLRSAGVAARRRAEGGHAMTSTRRERPQHSPSILLLVCYLG